MKSAVFCLVALLIINFSSTKAQTTILPFGASWKYLDNGTDQGTSWTSRSYSDRNWKVGRAKLGYGNGDEATLVSYGSNPNDKIITTYFRKVVKINDPALFDKFIIEIKRDDGAIVYINGIKRYVTNLVSKPLYQTLASRACLDNGNSINRINLLTSDFLAGNNTIAIEIHQASANDPDMSFDFRLSGNKAPLANAGLDVNITLPSNSVSLNGNQSSDPDGNIRNYLWTKISGPDGDLIATPTKVSTLVTNLTKGTYTYRLTVTDNNKSTSTDDVVVTVNSVDITGQPTLFIDWNTITLPTTGLPDGTRFANDKLRSNVAYDSYSQKIVNGKMKFTVDSQVPVDPTISSAQYHFRSEFSEWPWNINLPEGTEQWAGWSYYFMSDYVRAVHPISIFQNHAASSYPYPGFQLELSRPGQLPGALGGEIQVINECSSPTVRKLTTVRPNPGDRVDIVLHVVHARDNNGLLEFWINGVLVHSQIGSTIYPAPENWGGNNKWGIYHHTWTDPANVLLDIAAGHTKFELLMGNLRQITRTSTDPNYRADSRAVVDPAQDATTNSTNARSINSTSSGSSIETSVDKISEKVIEFTASPVPVRRGDYITIKSNSPDLFEAIIVSSNGQRLLQFTSTESAAIQTNELAPGVYIINFSQGGKSINKRVVVIE